MEAEPRATFHRFCTLLCGIRTSARLTKFVRSWEGLIAAGVSQDMHMATSVARCGAPVFVGELHRREVSESRQGFGLYLGESALEATKMK